MIEHEILESLKRELNFDHVYKVELTNWINSLNKNLFYLNRFTIEIKKDIILISDDVTFNEIGSISISIEQFKKDFL